MAKLLVVIFGLAFGSVGLGMSGYALTQIWQWQDSAGWTGVQGKITALELRVNSDDSTTYGIDCQYSYSVGGKDYVGDSASFYSGTDNLGSFQQNLHQRLKAAQKLGVVDVWVDLDEPKRSVLDRTYRPGFLSFQLLFVFLFGSVGLGVITGMLVSREPKIVHDSWRIDSSNRMARFVSVVLAIYYTAVLSFSVPTTLICLANGQFAAILTLVLVVVIMAACWAAWRSYRNHKAIGRLMLPTKDASRSEVPRIQLPPSWQGPVEMDLRWTIPKPPSNQLGVEDESGEPISLELPSVSGTTRVTELPITLPELPTSIPGGTPLKLEVDGMIGGYPYKDEFEIPAHVVL